MGNLLVLFTSERLPMGMSFAGDEEKPLGSAFVCASS